MTERLLKTTAIYCGIFFVVGMFLVIFLGKNKTIEVSDFLEDEIAENNTPEQPAVQINKNEITFSSEMANTEYLCIPLPKETKAEDIVIENHYMDGELRILIANMDASFFASNKLSGNRSLVKGGRFEQKNKDCLIRLDVSEVLEYRTIFENNELFVSFLKPKELYEKIVVIDPLGGGANKGATANEITEKDISLLVAKKVKERLDESGIKAYYTRMDDVNPSEEARVYLANNTKADMYVRIGVSRNSDESVYGISCEYNDEYFIPGFGSIELSDIMEKEIVTATKGKALGLIKSGKDNIAMADATVPVTSVSIGCISNKQEAILLGREDYIEKIAEGIYNGIVKACEE